MSEAVAEQDGLQAPADRPWPRPWMSPFLRALALIPDVSSAVRQAHVSRATVYRYQKSDRAFAEAWEECFEIAKDHVQQVAHTWITVGVPVLSRKTTTRTKTDKDGNVVETTTEVIETTSRERSAALMVFWLKAHYPEKYRWADRFEATGRDGGPIQLESLEDTDAQIAALAAEIRERANGAPVPIE